MHELEKHYRITYDSWEGFYKVHTPRGTVKFHKDEQGLPFIDLDGSSQDAAKMLVQLGQHVTMAQTKGNDEHTMLVETVRGNFEGFTKNEVLMLLLIGAVAFGIRLENLIVVEPAPHLQGGDSEREQLRFETLTFVPLDRRLILTDRLSPDEREWLNAYHAETLAKLGPRVSAFALAWLQAACAPL